jgi:hypothetical protein
VLVACWAEWATPARSDDDILGTLRNGHPRLYRSASEFESLKRAVQDNPVLH